MMPTTHDPMSKELIYVFRGKLGPATGDSISRHEYDPCCLCPAYEMPSVCPMSELIVELPTDHSRRYHLCSAMQLEKSMNTENGSAHTLDRGRIKISAKTTLMYEACPSASQCCQNGLQEALQEGAPNFQQSEPTRRHAHVECLLTRKGRLSGRKIR